MPILEGVDAEKFREAMLAEKPALDERLKDDTHGLLTHMFQEYVLAEEWGGRRRPATSARRSRRSKALQQRTGRRCSPGSGRAVRQASTATHQQTGVSRPILHEHLKLPRKAASALTAAQLSSCC